MSDKTDSAEEIIAKRKEKIIQFFENILKGKSNPLFERTIYGIMLFSTIVLSIYIRIQNLPLLKGKYLLGLDPYFFYRYATIIYEKGALPAIDYMRYSPVGYPTLRFKTLSYLFVYMYKIAKFFYSGLTQMQWHEVYPPIITAISFIFFFLMIKETFNKKTALISTALLAVLPAYLYRTGGGFADHEAIAMLFMFMSIYFFIMSWKKNNLRLASLFMIISATSAGLMAASWGGVKFLTVSIFIFLVIYTLLKPITKKELIKTGLFVFPYIFLANLFSFWAINSEIFAADNLGLAAIFFYMLLTYLIKNLKSLEKFRKKFEKKVAIPILSGIVGLIIFIPIFISLVSLKLVSLHLVLTRFFGHGLSRFETTVSESMMPQIIPNWISKGNFGTIGLILFFVGALFLVYYATQNSKKNQIFLSSVVGAFLLIFLGSSLSLNFQSKILGKILSSNYMLLSLGIFLIIFGYYMHLYYKDKDNFKKLQEINWRYFFIISFFLVTLLTAKVSTRFLFSLAPFAMIVSGFFISKTLDIINQKKKIQWVSIIIVVFLVILLLSNARISYYQNKYSGSGYPGQWENSMNWLKENTPENAVIAHWWDYGYWTQTMGNRTTVGDGGNLMGWNHDLGRYAMTGKNETKYLSYLKTHKVTHLLYSEEEIGKYHAFSYIGSDENLDRESTIGIFSLLESKEIRNGTRYFYSGGWGLDKDYAIGNLIYEKNVDGLGGFSYDIVGNEITNPIAYLVKDQQAKGYKARCICEAGNCTEFEDYMFDGCFVFAPYIQTDQRGMQQLFNRSALFYLSPKVDGGLFAELYMKNQKIDAFKEVYNDGTPLALYNGRIIGPIRIWEVNYPEWVEEDNIYLQSSHYG